MYNLYTYKERWDENIKMKFKCRASNAIYFIYFQNFHIKKIIVFFFHEKEIIVIFEEGENRYKILLVKKKKSCVSIHSISKFPIFLSLTISRTMCIKTF